MKENEKDLKKLSLHAFYKIVKKEFTNILFDRFFFFINLNFHKFKLLKQRI